MVTILALRFNKKELERQGSGGPGSQVPQPKQLENLTTGMQDTPPLNQHQHVDQFLSSWNAPWKSMQKPVTIWIQIESTIRRLLVH